MNNIEKRVINGLKQVRDALFIWGAIQLIFMLLTEITHVTLIIFLLFMFGWAGLYRFISGYENTKV